MCSIQCNSRASRRAVQFVVMITATTFFVLTNRAPAQQDFLAPQPHVSAPQWVVGPASAPLGDSAEILIPEGCRFTDESGARAILTSSRQPVPPDLLGLLLPDSHQWLAIVRFTEIGYVKDAGKVNLDADAILKKYQANIARQSRERAAMDSRVTIPDLSWELQPVFDPALNRLEYALKVQGMTGGSVNYFVDWLGRRGTLSVTLVQLQQVPFNLGAMRDAVKGIAFKSGDRYQDHKQGDRVARLGLADMILNSDGAEPPSRLARLMEHRWFWLVAAGGVVVFALACYGLAVLLLRKRKTRYYRMDDEYQRRNVIHQHAGTANGHAASDNGQPYPGVANGGIAQPVNGGFRRNGHRRRKKRFSYHAFYSDMVMNLTRSNYAGAPGIAYAGVDVQPATGIETLTAAPAHNPSLPDTANLLVAETSKLIASQQKLIEGQRKLIEEQSRLIQEKSMLIGADIKGVNKQPDSLDGQ